MGYLFKPKYPPEGITYKAAGAAGTLRDVWCLVGEVHYVNGRMVRESTGIGKETEARRFLKLREGAVATGAALPPRLDRILYDELVADLKRHYETIGRRWLDEVEDRLHHLDQVFRGRRAASLGPVQITEYVAKRQAEKTQLGGFTSNRTVNIELALLKRMFRFGVKQGKVLRVPPIEMLKEAPAREGFFEAAPYEAVRRRLPPDLRVAVTIAQTFGWRVRSEVLTLERRHVDLAAGTLRLDPGRTKNGEGRVVYLTPELRRLLGEQLARVDQLARQLERILPWLFPLSAGSGRGSGGPASPRRGPPRATRPAPRGGSSTTSGGRRSGTSSGPACPGPSP